MKLTPDQLRQNAAAMLAFADGKPIEYEDMGVWHVADNIRAIDRIPHRPKPWTLPAPPAGKQWGWEGQWKAEWLPEGCRPLLRGEERRAFDEFLTSYDGNRWLALSEDMEPAPDTYQPHRTRRPLPAEPVVRPWSKPEDVPGPVCWIRSRHDDGRPDYREYLIIAFADPVSYITASAGCKPVVCSHQFSETRWENMEHSTDRKTWLPCTVTQ